LAESQYLSISASKSGPALKAVPKISKQLVAYLEGLLAVSPYANGFCYSRAKGVAEAAATEAFKILNLRTNEAYMHYLKRKLGEWYREAPRPVRRQPPVPDEDEPAQADDTEEAPDIEEAVGGGDGGGISLDK
jgi:hypothetical protein